MTTHTERTIQSAVAGWFDWRRNLIIPNVCDGFGLNHEADLLVLSKSRYLTEIEVKISAGDLRRDLKKPAGHSDRQGRIRRLFFAIPEALSKYVPLIPVDAGILVVQESGRVDLIRAAKSRPGARRLSESEILDLYRLGGIKFWAVLDELVKVRNREVRIHTEKKGVANEFLGI